MTAPPGFPGSERPAVRPTVESGLDPFGLGQDGDQAALVSATGTVTYAELLDRVRSFMRRLGTTRRLVLIEAGNDVPSVVAYLAALAGGHPALLVEPGRSERHRDLIDVYGPDVLVRAGTGSLIERRPGTAHDLHPDLALLLSTSGSTGSPKLVRLSRDNLVANAASIAEYLRLRPDDRATTSLPLHYCYGLSVLNSHLLAGAGVVLTELSVVDECFWELFRSARATSLAGVPYTFDLLEASGFATRELPSLRYVTQAGGRMAPERVTHFARLGRERGWDLYVMYGQTEATARMAWLSPELAEQHPSTIGVPVPGGRFRLSAVPEARDVHGPDVGELVYEGPNVMLGYAREPADLARGRDCAALHTGDLGRLTRHGLWEVVGRRDRIAKVFGLRLDLDRVEQLLRARNLPARCVGLDDELWVFSDRPRTRDRLRAAASESTGLPASAIRVERLEAMPLTRAGKVDYAVLAEQGRRLRDRPSTGVRAGPVTATDIRDLYAMLLGRPDATVLDSFVALGGDSLSYVELSVRLGRRLGALPANWHMLSPEELVVAARPRRRGVTVETSVLLRAVAIVLIVASHADVIAVMGGAHLLLAVAGYNFARFRLPTSGLRARVRGVLSSVAQLAVPSMLWIGGVALVAGTYQPATALLLNGVLGSDGWTDDWQMWFLEALAWTLFGAAVLLAVPAFDRVERRAPFATALTLLAGTVLLRFLWTGLTAGPTERYTVGLVLWCFALGWAVAVARTRMQRLAVVVAVFVATLGFFGDLKRELLVVAGVLVLLVGRSVVLPRFAAGAVATVASASLYVYLTHWQVYPELEAAGHPYVAVLASLAAGIALWLGSRVATSGLRRLWSQRTCILRTT
ncbi:MAG: AMP-binding protein [Propionibacteriales bacterium]|nr:AMP-binding protein [Propionibacteriales bacterium]